MRIGVRGLEGTAGRWFGGQRSPAPSRTVTGKGPRGAKLRPGHDAVAFSCGGVRKRRELPNEPNSMHAGLSFVKNEANNEPKFVGVKMGQIGSADGHGPRQSCWGSPALEQEPE